MASIGFACLNTNGSAVAKADVLPFEDRLFKVVFWVVGGLSVALNNEYSKEESSLHMVSRIFPDKLSII